MNIKKILAVFGCSLTLSISACMSVDDQIESNKERASQIIQAIDAYAQEHGQFPEQLDVLVPEYITEIPKTVQDWDFSYRVLMSGHYELGFDLASIPDKGCGYASKYEEWECSPGIRH